MAKANIDTKSGTKITIEGTTEEISEILGVIQKREEGRNMNRRSRTQTKNSGTKLSDLILELREEGFFDKQQGLVEVKKMLEEKGHIYPVTTLSGTLLSQVKKKILRRLPEGKRWVYVKGSV